MIIALLLFLLQTFCYGASRMAEGSLETIITDSGVSPFFYKYCEKFYEEFQDYNIKPLPDRRDVYKLVGWCQQYLYSNAKKFPEDRLAKLLDHDLRAALATDAYPYSVTSDKSTKQSPSTRKGFVVCQISLNAVASIVTTYTQANLCFIASSRFLTSQDFTGPIFERDPFFMQMKKSFLENTANQHKDMNYEILAQTARTALISYFFPSEPQPSNMSEENDHALSFDTSADELLQMRDSLLDRVVSAQKSAILAKNAQFMADTEYTALSSIAEWVQTHHSHTMRMKVHEVSESANFFLTSLLYLQCPSFSDGMLSSYPFSLARKKLADHILKRSIPVYDIYDKTPSNRKILRALGSAFIVEYYIGRKDWSTALIHIPYD